MRAQRHRRSVLPCPAPPGGPGSPGRRQVLATLAALAALTNPGLGGCGRRDADAPGESPQQPAAATPAHPGPLLWTGRPGGLDTRAAAPSVHPSLVAFRRRTGIDVRYLPEAHAGADADERLWSTLAAALTRGRPCGLDLVVLGDAATARVLAADWAEPLGPGALPGLAAVLPALRRSTADPGRRFSVPWRSAYTGLVWDTARLAEPLAAVDDLWRADLGGRVVLPRNWQDGLAVLAMASGGRVDGPPAQVRTSLHEALGTVERRVRQGRLLGVADPVEALLRGRALAGVARSTDVQRLQARAPGRFSFVVPDTGALLVTDSLLVPRGTPRRADVLRLIDHYLQPAVAAGVSLTVPGLCPVPGAQEVMRTLDARRSASPLLFPTDADLTRCQALAPQDAGDDAGYAQAYARLIGP